MYVLEAVFVLNCVEILFNRLCLYFLWSMLLGYVCDSPNNSLSRELSAWYLEV